MAITEANSYHYHRKPLSFHFRQYFEDTLAKVSSVILLYVRHNSKPKLPVVMLDVIGKRLAVRANYKTDENLEDH
ncbi:MAG: hypothetical protein PHH38_02325 [Candidatus Cloacimonetes bacterium]|nr:hypothetical protein [Candidatus Cloacimonadota bacterium]